MKIFLAGIMQGSHQGLLLHEQDYRGQLDRALRSAFPEAELYDPLADHQQSIHYQEEEGRRVFFYHNRLCREVDFLLAYAPQASMGTAIEMWEAYDHDAFVVCISPMVHNWAIRFLSHALYPSMNEFMDALSRGEIARLYREHVIKWKRMDS